MIRHIITALSPVDEGAATSRGRYKLSTDPGARARGTTRIAVAPEQERTARPVPEQPLRYELDQTFLANLVGVIALFLSIGFWIIGETVLDCMPNSISHFYYSRFWGSVFVASLSMIAAFLMAYRSDIRRENIAASLAGAAALGVAVFPTSGHGCSPEQVPFTARPFLEGLMAGSDPERLSLEAGITAVFRLSPVSDYIHYGSAAVMFGFLAWYCWRVMARVNVVVHRDEYGDLTRVKVVRNTFYLTCAIVICLCLTALILNFALYLAGRPLPGWDEGNWTFILEFVALLAFGVAWIVRGRLFGLRLRDMYRPIPALAESPPWFWAD